MDKERVAAFLYFGYLPREKDVLETKSFINDFKPEDGYRGFSQENDLVEEGVKLFKSLFKDIQGENHIVPLSGGVDSRAVLGGLLTQINSNKINTVTFGTPGSLDYQIGNHVAKELGTRHENIDLSRVELEQEALEKVAESMNSAWTYLFDAFYNRIICDIYGKTVIYWSGFLGDATGGKHLPAYKSKTWDEAVRFFIYRHRMVKSMSLLPPDFSPADALSHIPLLKKERLNFDDQLDLIVRQQDYVKPTIIPENYSYQCPFSSSAWMDFMLSLSDRHGSSERLYKNILLKSFPVLFTLPCASSFRLSLNASGWRIGYRRYQMRAFTRLQRYFPAWEWGTRAYIKYIDFDKALRERKSFKELVYYNLQDLKKRGLVDWLDLDKMWKRHQRKTKNHADALILLAALEINLKVKA